MSSAAFSIASPGPTRAAEDSRAESMTAQFSSRMRRVWFKLDSRTLQLAGAGGIIGVLVRGAGGTRHAIGLILVGLGTSVLASVLVGGIALGRDELLQQLLGDG